MTNTDSVQADLLNYSIIWNNEMDNIDRASLLETQDRERALLKQANKQKPVGSAICLLCDEPVPEARQKILPHATLCVDCQRIEEQRNQK